MTDGTTDRVKVDFNEGVAHVRLNRPEKKNALDAGMFEGLLSVARALRDDLSVRAVVLSGEGDSFCSGLDFSSFGDMASGALNPESESIQQASRDLSRDGANRAQQKFKFLEEGDLKEALAAASAIGDDNIQKKSRGYVVPDSFTHGSAEQRTRWFTLGLRSGDPAAHSPFDMEFGEL